MTAPTCNRADPNYAANLLDEYEWLRTWGKTPERCAKELGSTLDAIRQLRKRRGMRDTLKQ